MEILDVLESLKSGKISVSKAKKLLSLYSIEKIEDFAQIDMGRRYRKGIPEVVFAERKQLDEIKKIITKILAKSNSVLISRIQKQDYSKIIAFAKKNKFKIKDGKNTTTLLLYKKEQKSSGGVVGIVTAGTSDIGVAEEARLTCEAMNCTCICSYDVGIAGLHRIFPIIKKFVQQNVDVIVVAAGMEGALASVVASLVNVPVIGLPTSVGYGYGEKGVAALASMLQSCSLGLSVVNIDNGIGAGAVAANIANVSRRQ
ncbi:MAG TPA: nickel pincer cofactor biosynthesis protein LarB [Candidatus Nitrosotenuis sp.]|nr:nickel pincer cofactor biosynthesis protein LarB [Candidatus Nitrosotenuis sp.]